MRDHDLECAPTGTIGAVTEHEVDVGPVVREQAANRWLRAWALALPIYLAAMLVLQGAGGDFRLADALFAAEGGHWTFRENPFAVEWLHDGGKRFVEVLWGFGLLAAILSSLRPARARFRRPLWGLVGSVAASALVIATLKYSVPVDCPWGLVRYGGAHPPLGLFEAWPVNWAPNGCFPAAHAGSGFAWVALYFFFREVRPAWRHAGLAFGLGLGVLFAVAQELRGAHFLSHDLTSLMLCWTIALAVHLLLRRRSPACMR